jgi:hypothetical protein
MKFSQQTPENRELSQNYINARWRGLQAAIGTSLSRVIGYLFALNSGSIVACVTYVATKGSNATIKLSLWIFIIGVISVLLRATWDYYSCESIFREFRNDVSLYHADKLDWVSLRDIDKRRVPRDWIGHSLGWFSGICFVVGIVIGVRGLN